MTANLNSNDLKTAARLLTVIWLGLSFVVLLREVAGSITVRDWDYYALGDLYDVTFRMWMPWVFMSPFVVMLIKKFLFYPEKWMRNLGFHLLFVGMFTLIHVAAIAFHYEFFVEDKSDAMQVYAGWEHMGHFLVADPFILTDIIIYVLFVTSFNISSHIQLVRQKEQVASKLRTYLAESKLEALRMQVNPHFLFNTLNSISVLVQKNEMQAAGEMIHRLSDFFRMTLEKNTHQFLPLESELELTENYLAIEQERFRDRLEIKKSIDPRTLAIEVPVMLLQPLVENSLRHGIGEIEGTGHIEIHSTLLAGDRLQLEIIDNGPGKVDFNSPEFKEGIGLSNVRSRLSQLYGGDFSFILDSAPQRGVRVRIEIPVSREQPTATETDDAPISDPSPAMKLKFGET